MFYSIGMIGFGFVEIMNKSFYAKQDTKTPLIVGGVIIVINILLCNMLASILGLNGLVVKTHGSSKSTEITNALFQCVTFKQQNINGKIKEHITVETTTEE